MEIIQEIGSYAGFAAIVGLALLSALYFSQARDVKRLREWAGRAPERVTPPPAQPQRVVAQPIPRPPAPTQPAVPSPAPAPAQASAAGATPSVARAPAPATPAASRGESEAAGAIPLAGGQDGGVAPPPAESHDEDAAAPPAEGHDEDATVVQPPQPGDEQRALEGGQAAAAIGSGEAVEAEAQPLPAGERDERDEDDDEGEDTGEWSPEDEHSELVLADEHELGPPPSPGPAPRAPLPPRPFPRPAPPRPAPASGRATAAADRPPLGSGRDKPRRSRRPLLVAAAALAAFAIAGFAVVQVLGGGDEVGGGLTTGDDQAADGAPRGPVDPASVTVAVLNGTTVPGLAATLGDRVANHGFELGTVTNNFDQERAESVVLYARGAEREAAAVGRRLDIAQREPIDPSSQGLAGDARVVVVAGADQTQ